MTIERRRSASLAFAALVAGQVGAALGAALRSDGLFASGTDAPFPCRTLLSSGRDDEVWPLLPGTMGCADLWGTLVQAHEPYAVALAACTLLAPLALAAAMGDDLRDASRSA